MSLLGLVTGKDYSTTCVPIMGQKVHTRENTNNIFDRIIWCKSQIELIAKYNNRGIIFVREICVSPKTCLKQQKSSLQDPGSELLIWCDINIWRICPIFRANRINIQRPAGLGIEWECEVHRQGDDLWITVRRYRRGSGTSRRRASLRATARKHI